MRTTFRTASLAVAAVAVTGAVALTAPGMAKGLFDAQNAHKVDGLHANQLTKTQYFKSSTVFDDFDTCAMTDVRTAKFKTTHAGVISVTSSVSAARDTDDPNEGILTTRILLDGKVISQESSANLENDGTEDATVVGIGAGKAGRGTHTIKVQAQECGPGMAFIHHESLVAEYSPFGGAPAGTAPRPVTAKLNR
ncbi:MAG TPA: hypothetical protein PLP61_03455 [Nocardioides sp.]|uniref:hypothetical protein n=1 Tax=Nocardioides sp. TaxID=35761 RepID=UPI002D015218|nr:hypothetical protein [Nocardioides sp.]HQR26076.1 hypothetical protein [Nocardioides sp.]